MRINEVRPCSRHYSGIGSDLDIGTWATFTDSI